MLGNILFPLNMDNTTAVTRNGTLSPVFSDVCFVLPYYCKNNSDLFRTVAIIYAIILMLLILVLNAPVFVTILHLNSHKIKPANMFTLSLGVTDTVGACLYLPVLVVVLQRGEGTQCDVVCSLLVTEEKALIALSTWGIALLSMERYMFICKRKSYKTKLTNLRAFIWIVCVWIMCGVIGSVSYFLSASSRHVTGECICHLSSSNYGFFNLGFSAFYVVCCYFLPTTLVVFLYSYIIHFVSVYSSCSLDQRFVESESHKNGHLLPDPDQDVDKRATYQSHHTNYTKAVNLLSCQLLMYLLMTLPYFVVIIVVSMGHWQVHTHPYYLHIISILLFYTNSACNVLFYGYTNRRLRTILFRSISRSLFDKDEKSSGVYQVRDSPRKLSVMGDTTSRSDSRVPSIRSEISVLSTFSRPDSIKRTAESRESPSVSDSEIDLRSQTGETSEITDTYLTHC